MKQDFEVKCLQFVPEFHTALLTKSRPNVKRNKQLFLMCYTLYRIYGEIIRAFIALYFEGRRGHL